MFTSRKSCPDFAPKHGKNSRFSQICVKFCVKGFLGYLTDQYDGQNFKILNNLHEAYYKGVFQIANFEFNVQYLKFKFFAEFQETSRICWK